MALVYFFYFGSFVTSIVNPFWGLVAIIFSVLIRFQDRFPDIVAIKPFSLLFLGMIIGCIVNKDKLAKQNWLQDKLLIWMLVVSILGLLIMKPSDIISETWQFVSSLAFYYFATRIMQEPKHFVILFAVMSCCIVYMGYEVIIEVAKDPQSPIFIRNGRWQGLGYYSNANEFGQLMITTIPFLLAALLMKSNILIKLTSIIFIGLLVFVVGKTESRTVMVLLGLIVIGTFVLRGSGNIILKTMKGGSLGLLLIVALSFAPGPIQDRLETVLNAGSDASFQGRTRSWGYGFEMVMWYPITGVGKGQWSSYHGLMPHNSYVQIMAELGPVGIFLFIWILKLCFMEFRPFFFETDVDPPGGSSPTTGNQEDEIHPIFGVQNKVKSSSNLIETEQSTDDVSFQREPVDMQIKTIVIAVVIVMIAWLTYIFLGNQGYAVWTYFYIGLCSAIRNIHPKIVTLPCELKNV